MKSYINVLFFFSEFIVQVGTLHNFTKEGDYSMVLRFVGVISFKGTIVSEVACGKDSVE